MTRWAAFAGLTGVVLALLVLLAHASTTIVDEPAAHSAPAGERTESDRSNGEREPDGRRRAEPAPESMPTGTLLVNVALTQGLLGTLLFLGAWYTEVPPAALGLSGADSSHLLVGAGLGVALYVANELLASAAAGVGIEYEEELRELLAPDSLAGWVLLLGFALPLIAAFEELLFRGALVGAMSAGFGVSPWLLAVGSTVAFALGHGMQGPGGIVVTGLLGFALAAAFVLTGSLLVVVTAHYLVNVFEFVVHEGFEVEWTRSG